MRVLITGKTGQVVTAMLERAGDAVIMPLGRPELDLARADGIGSLLSEMSPDVIVSAAAYTAVDNAEAEPALAHAINARAPGCLAKAAADLDIPIIHISTDYVFDGNKPTPYVEADATAPLGVYGRSKLAGEQAVAVHTANHAILRTAWLYSPFGNNFAKTILRRAVDRSELRVVSDQLGNPTSAIDIVDAILAVARNMISSPDDAQLRGVFHLTAEGEASWADFAREIMTISREMNGPSADVVGISAAEYPTAARRPANSRLSSAKLAAAHGVVLPAWQESIRTVLPRLICP